MSLPGVAQAADSEVDDSEVDDSEGVTAPPPGGRWKLRNRMDSDAEPWVTR
ncbi:hypothetical protein [Streptomyces sp. NPDC000878]